MPHHTNSTVCLCILEIYVWKVTLLSSYLLLDYFYYLPVKRRKYKFWRKTVRKLIMETINRFFCSKIIQIWIETMKYFENSQISAGGRSQVNYRNVLLMLYFYFKKVKNKWKIKKWINKKITCNTSFRLISFRRRNVFQTRWMMPAACCLKRKQPFSQ